MLQEKLQPLIAQIQDQSEEDRTRTVHDWFEAHTENMVGDPFEMPYLCELPNDVRRLVTYPVIGNLVLSRLSGFQPRNDYQRTLLEMARHIIEETRFHNHHTGDVKPLSFIQMETEFTARMLEKPGEAIELQEYITGVIEKPLSDIIYDQLQKVPGKTYTTDFGQWPICAIK
ncbi:MAG: hypothetical protein WC613_05660 [Candidatus Aenigmatarchaeota archaeon]